MKLSSSTSVLVSALAVAVPFAAFSLSDSPSLDAVDQRATAPASGTRTAQRISSRSPIAPGGSTAAAGAPLDTPKFPGKVKAFFEPISTLGEFFKFHHAEDVGQLDFTVRLNTAAPPGGVDVYYALGGDAELGVHYAIVAGSASPIRVDGGTTSKTISIQALQGTRYFDERLLTLQLQSGHIGIKTGEDLLRVYLRSVVDPPTIEFNKSTTSGGAGLQAPKVRLFATSTDSAEPANLHWYQSNAGQPNAAVLGVDYEWFPGAGPGEVVLDIPNGVTTAPVPFTVLPTATDGRILEMTLDHERSDRFDENLYTTTRNYEFEHTDQDLQDIEWPGEPGDNTSGPGSVASNGPIPITVFPDPGTLHPDSGEPLFGMLLTDQAAGNGYHRKSFNNQVFCGGPVQLLELRRYNRISAYVELPSVSAPAVAPSRFIRLSIRDRITAEAHAVVFDRESPDGGLLGTPVVTPTGSWGVFAVSEWSANSEFGVELENGRTRLWSMYREEDGTKIGHPTGRLIWPVWFGSDGTVNLVGDEDDNWLKGLLIYDVSVQMNDAPTSGPPGRFREKLRQWWEPRGRATVDPTGNVVHTFTIDLP